MSVRTQLLDFVIPPVRSDNELHEIHNKILQVFQKFLSNLELLQTKKLSGSVVSFFSNGFDVLLTIRIFEKGLINLLVEYEVKEDGKPAISFEEAEQIEKIINKNVENITRSQVR